MNAGAIDLYCERTGPEFWAEPVNALTNLAFIVAALALTWKVRREPPRVAGDGAIRLLIALTFLIGIGSGLFHTLAVTWAMWADIVPITAYILVYVFLALRRFFRLGRAMSGGGVALVGIATGVLPLLTGARGSSYLPALFAMLAAGALLRLLRNRQAGLRLVLAGAVFAVSLGFRTADGALCETLPAGTHFLWHLLNAAVLYLATDAMIVFVRADKVSRQRP